MPCLFPSLTCGGWSSLSLGPGFGSPTLAFGGFLGLAVRFRLGPAVRFSLGPACRFRLGLEFCRRGTEPDTVRAGQVQGKFPAPGAHGLFQTVRGRPALCSAFAGHVLVSPTEFCPQACHPKSQSLNEVLPFRLAPLGHLVVGLAKAGFHGSYFMAQVSDKA
jgi:hypothetical protein